MRIRAAFLPSSLSQRIVWVLVFLIAIQPKEILARVGGGQSYGGGNGGGGDGDAGAIIWIIFELVRLLIYLTIEYPMIGIPLDIIVLGGVIYYFSRASRSTREGYTSLSLPSTTADAGQRRGGFAREFEHLRRFDPNFSEIVFTDFCYALYGKAQNARADGANALDLFSPYLSGAARNALLQRNPAGLAEVKGVIVGAMQIADVSGLESPVVRIGIMFEANYTEQLKSGATDMTYYVRERWDLERRRDVLSPTPAEATALHCPRCGAALQRDTIGACAFCGAKIDSGEFQWYVRSIVLLNRESRGPLLTSDVPEVGTNYPSVVQPGFASVRAEFEKSHPEFSWEKFQERVRLIFNELQAAWSSLNWERARPHETDSIFQMHQYWIDAYKRQGLRNVVDQCAITAIQPVKIKEDAFYNSITLRIWAQGYDYTQRADGTVVSGSKTNLRRWSEYWTFIRNRNAQPLPARVDLNCPNCGAPLKVNVTGICEFCGGKVTSGEFDWVLSRIEQDESYTG
ncbi:MAG TPA: Tim44-like domain-containing protein [Pyrinomonadaceae bacterium]|nr:Tim44-like domain-containing protein [Pyrinomonadaceae bacterium]